MPIVPPGSKILVTGANGFIAVWLIRTLLEKGYSVRGVVRSPSKGEYLSKLFRESLAYGEKFELCYVEDMLMVRGSALDFALRVEMGYLEYRPLIFQCF
jgi:nucleoside-diphosphate-sugar epimerase